MHFGGLRPSKPLTAGAGGRPGGARGWMQHVAFLAPDGRSQRLRRACTGQTRTHGARRARGSSAPMARAAGGGTRLPRRERAHAAGPWQPRTHGGPIPRYTVPNAPRHAASQRAAYILGYIAQPIGRNRRRVRQAAFLAAEGRSQRLRRAGAGQVRTHGARRARGRPAPMAGLSQDIPSQTRHATLHHNAPHISPRNIPQPIGRIPPPPAPSRVSCVLRTLATLTAAPAALPFAAENGPCHSERRVGMGPARKRAATQPIPRTARAAAHGGRTCEATRKEGTKTPCSN